MQDRVGRGTEEEGYVVMVIGREEASMMKVVCMVIGVEDESMMKVGSQAPEGYLNWHDWAEVQHKAGLRQVPCPRCGLWRFPQEPCIKNGVCPSP